MDLVLGTVMLVISIPAWSIIALLVKFDTPGPVFFRHERVGRGGAMFQVLKFRTMFDGTHQAMLASPESYDAYKQNDFKLSTDDPCISRVGRFLRRTSLDEVPQLWNVVRGDMSLVGIRPLVQEELQGRTPSDQDLYVSMRPGMTGAWQVAGRIDAKGTNRVALDRSYVETWSARRDLALLLRTPAAAFRFSRSTHGTRSRAD